MSLAFPLSALYDRRRGHMQWTRAGKGEVTDHWRAEHLVYGARQFRRMVEQANGLALEVMADDVFLAGDDEFRKEIEALAASTRERLGIERTPGGWRLTHNEAAR